MIDTPRITAIPAQLVAKIHLTIPRSEIRSMMGPGLSEVMATVSGQGIGPTGPWFTHHLQMQPATFDFEICVPVSAPVAAVGRVVPGEIPAITAARTVHEGPYEGLATAWREFHEWIGAQGHVARQDLLECYLAGPESSPDAARWRTELIQPLVE